MNTRRFEAYFKTHIELKHLMQCSVCFMIFAYFINYDLPLKGISFIALTYSAFLMSNQFRSTYDIKKLLGDISISKRTFKYAYAGVLVGLADAVIYRYQVGMAIFPETLHRFAILAPLIGIAEEIVFRGYIQVTAQKVSIPFSIFLSTITHTAYKICLFLSPVIEQSADIKFLLIGGLIGSFVFGTLRYLTESILPSAIGHGLFDLLVYGGLASAPWWVW